MNIATIERGELGRAADAYLGASPDDRGDCEVELVRLILAGAADPGRVDVPRSYRHRDETLFVFVPRDPEMYDDDRLVVVPATHQD